MKTVLETCTPRLSITQGTFNPEVFTASLSPVIEFYRAGEVDIDSIYTDGEVFFRDATYATQGLKDTVSSVFRRIAGDSSAPSIYRLETAFGGGKTHCLIACVHIANRGTELASVTADILDPTYLPESHSVKVVGIAGDEIPVTKSLRDGLVPYTLWGEIAYQIGGETLYNEVRAEAESFAAPGRDFLDRVLGGRKLLIMLDELAQYAARLSVAQPGGEDQLAAFIMTLNGYAKTHNQIAIVVTLAGAVDAFSKQTERLTKLLNEISAGEMSQDDAIALAERASRGVTSVTMRDATAVTPVQASEIASVLAKRLFANIDSEAAVEVADEYVAMYRRNSPLLPEEAASERFRDRLIMNYPFHPTLVDFLNQKLAQAENFQGTRGVLRVLALTIRSIWQKRPEIFMIQTGDIDMKNTAIVNELLGRTSSADLQLVLNADIGSADSLSLESRLSNAGRADLRNPHPDGIPLYETTWKTVFLNSLVGRSEGFTSKLFGISQPDAILAVATPLATPPQIRAALDEINESAFYLRYENDKYFAHLDPTINSVLAMIRQTISDKQIREQLRVTAGNLIGDDRHFNIERDVHYPEDIPDGRDRLTLGVISFDVTQLEPEKMFTTKGEFTPRERQNMVLLLVPKTTEVITGAQVSMGGPVPGKTQKAAEEARERAYNTARQVLAIKALKERPHAYGISPTKLQGGDFATKEREREMALSTVVSELYNGFYYPSRDGSIIRKEIRPVSGEGGVEVIGQILSILQTEKTLITDDVHTMAELKSLADEFFFKNGDRIDVDRVLDSFYQYRSWPKLVSRDALEKLLRDGVEKGVWMIYKMPDDPEATHPSELYKQEKGSVPMSVTLLGSGYSLMTPLGVKQRGWLDGDTVPSERVRDVIKEILQASGAVVVGDVSEAVKQNLANVTNAQIDREVQRLIQSGYFSIYQGDPHQTEVPEILVGGIQGSYYQPQEQDVIISISEQSERGWLDQPSRNLRLSGNEGARKLIPLLKRLGSLYTRSGAKSVISEMDITDISLAGGGKLRVSLENVLPEDVKHLDEFFQLLADAGKITDDTEADVVINQPDDDDALVKELRK